MQEELNTKLQGELSRFVRENGKEALFQPLQVHQKLDMGNGLQSKKEKYQLLLVLSALKQSDIDLLQKNDSVEKRENLLRGISLQTGLQLKECRKIFSCILIALGLDVDLPPKRYFAGTTAEVKIEDAMHTLTPQEVADQLKQAKVCIEEENTSGASEIYTSLATAGVPEAMYYLGKKKIHSQAEYTQKEGVSYLEQAAANGYEIANEDLGNYYFSCGEFAKAMHCYEMMYSTNRSEKSLSRFEFLKKVRCSNTMQILYSVIFTIICFVLFILCMVLSDAGGGFCFFSIVFQVFSILAFGLYALGFWADDYLEQPVWRTIQFIFWCASILFLL